MNIAHGSITIVCSSTFSYRFENMLVIFTKIIIKVGKHMIRYLFINILLTKKYVLKCEKILDTTINRDFI